MRQNYKVVLLAICVAAGALLLYFIPPMGDVTKRVWMLSELFPDSTDMASEDIPDVATLTAAADSTAVADSTTVADSTALAENRPTVPTIPANMPDSVTPIKDYSGGAAGGMNHIVSLLNTRGKLQRKVRIAYYGDSFIESDILTCDLRQMLQDRFGGEGVGWVGCKSVGTDQKPTISIIASGITDKNHLDKGSFKQRLQGPSLRYYLPQNGAKLSLRGTEFRRHLSQWSHSQLYVRAPQGMTVTAKASLDTVSTTYTLEGSEQVQVIETMSDSTARLDYSFNGVGNNSQLLGVALEGSRGIQLDNFGMRSESGWSVATIPDDALSAVAAHHSYDLIFIHFGLNATWKGISNAQCRAYIDKTKLSIQHLRQYFPQATIVVVSVSDRDQRTAEGLHTMDGVERMVAHQEIMAQECGVCFLNLFEAMGGRDSMAGLVQQGKANKDYTHINFKGGEVLAKRIYDALMVYINK
ncbi:MAG: hypothetical protein J5486_06675 [Bacteroidaceae bacterium]|nr:hypothetical protein [Bacteroidaceae bacterium]